MYTNTIPFTPRFAFQAQPFLPPYVHQLGSRTRLEPQTGNILMDNNLIEGLVKHRQHVVDPLYALLNTSVNRYQICEGLYLAQRLAEENTPQVRKLYAAAARFNHTQDPLIQVYLAGFYRKLNVPESFGPMLEMLVRHANATHNPSSPHKFNPMEEVGGTLLQQIANFSADETLRRLQNTLRPTVKP